MTDLQTLAAKAVAEAEADGPAGLLITATYLLRLATDDDPRPLVELRDAVKAAIKARPAFIELVRFGKKVPTGWRFEFPNGHTVSVINDLHRPFRFETLTDDPADFDLGRGGLTPNLTSEQVERKLAAIYALPTQS